MSPIETTLAPLYGRENDPRIAADIAEINRQIGMIAGLLESRGDRRDHKYRKRHALRVIEQRAARALRKLERSES